MRKDYVLDSTYPIAIALRAKRDAYERHLDIDLDVFMRRANYHVLGHV